MRSKRPKPEGKWVFVPKSDMTPEEQEEMARNEVMEMVAFRHAAGSDNPFAALDEFHDYFPGNNMVPDGGAWILIKKPPFTEYTVPPMSIWFAEPWPHQGERHCWHRVKIMTPKGELGLYPREYAIVNDPSKYYEFVGEGMQMKFFGNEEGVPKDKLFYIRSRGVSKKDAIGMLIGSIKAHGVLWIEADKEVAMCFSREWPDESRLATV